MHECLHFQTVTHPSSPGPSLMGQNHSHHSFSQKYELVAPWRERAYVIPVRDWNRLVAQVEMTGDSPSDLLPLAWCLVGAASTAFFAALALPQSTGFATRLICWFTFGAALILGSTILYFANCQRRYHAERKHAIADEMRAMASSLNSRTL